RTDQSSRKRRGRRAEPAPIVPARTAAQVRDHVGGGQSPVDVALGGVPAAGPARARDQGLTAAERRTWRGAHRRRGAAGPPRPGDAGPGRERAGRAQRLPRGHRRVLRIASFQTPMIALAPVAVSVLEQRHPQLRAEIAQREVDAAYEGLLAHRFDVILGEDYPGGAQVVRSGTDREGLLRDPLLLVLPPHGPWADPAALGD